MEEKKYPAIEPKFYQGDEPFCTANGDTFASLVDYWRWAHSDLIGNVERGHLAEFLVACALGIQQRGRMEWDAYDLLSPEGISVEVKSSGYLQSWGQDRLSSISFRIPPTHAWDHEANEYERELRRQAKVYVFCVHHHTEQETLNPLDMSQWDFYVAPTRLLNENVGAQKMISLHRLLNIGARKCSFEELHEKIVEADLYEGVNRTQSE